MNNMIQFSIGIVMIAAALYLSVTMCSAMALKVYKDSVEAKSTKDSAALNKYMQQLSREKFKSLSNDEFLKFLCNNK